MRQRLTEELQAQFYNAINYPYQYGVPSDDVASSGVRKCQELCSFGLSATAAVVFSKYDALASFGAATAGYVAAHFIVGRLFKPFIPD